MLKREEDLASLESLYCGDARTDSLGICQFDDFVLYTAAAEEPPILIRKVGNLVNNQDRPDSFHMFTI